MPINISCVARYRIGDLALESMCYKYILCCQVPCIGEHVPINISCVARYLALESMCLLATSEFSHEAVKKHQDTIITALKVQIQTTVIEKKRKEKKENRREGAGRSSCVFYLFSGCHNAAACT